MGASLALAAALDQDEDLHPWTHPVQSASWALAAAVLLPIGLYLGWRYPDWFVMYTFRAGGWPYAARLLLALLPPVGLVLCAQLGLRLLDRGEGKTLVGVALGAGALGLVAALAGHRRLWWVGHYDAFHDQLHDLLQPLTGSRLGIALLFMVPALVGAWGFITFHLVRHRRRDPT